jgi:GT2 family glycosyltransferase
VKLAVVVPVRDNLHLTQSVVRHVLESEPAVSRLYVFDNGSRDGTLDWLRGAERTDPRLSARESGDNIYGMWRQGWEDALCDLGDDLAVAIINNDITLPYGALSELARALRDDERLWLVSPDPDRPLEAEVDATAPVRRVHGSYRHGGMLGWCFVVRGDCARRVDWRTDYEWWYGEDDLVYNIERLGGEIGRHTGVPCLHQQEATMRLHPELEEAKGRDYLLFTSRWGNLA